MVGNERAKRTQLRAVRGRTRFAGEMARDVVCLYERNPHPTIGVGFTALFSDACRAAGVPGLADATSGARRQVGRVLARLGLLRDLGLPKSRAVLALIGQISEFRFFPSAWTHEVVPYCFDTWPGRFDQWVAFFRRHRVRTAFFTASVAMRQFQRVLPDVSMHWMPEGCDLALHDPSRPLEQRGVDVLEYGRRLEAFHQRARPWLQQQGRVHVISRPGEPRLADMAALRRTLADARVCICFPRSQTDPAFAGDIETVTLRYLEAFASGCVVVGRSPRELVEWFGYDPVVEVDGNDPVDVLCDVLEHPGRYRPLVERNLQSVCAVGSWATRVQQILAVLRARGYGVPAPLNPG